MADPQPPPADEGINYREIARQIVLTVLEDFPAGQIAQWLSGTRVQSDHNAIAAGLNLASKVAVRFAEAIAQGEADSDPAFGRLAAMAVSDLLGVNVNASNWSGRGKRSQRTPDMAQITSALLGVFGGGQEALTPSTAPAQKFMGTMLSFAMEGWLEGWIFEMLSSVVPGIDDIETFAELDDILAEVMGFGRLSRRVLSPLVDATIVTPMEWHVNKTYRPRLLTPGDVTRQVRAGLWSKERGDEELARQGWSDDRIAAFYNSDRKYLSVDDVLFLVREGGWSLADATAYLREQGHDAGTAEWTITAALTKRIAAFRDDSLAAIKSAYANRGISDSEFRTLLQAVVYDPEERNALETAMRTARELNVKGLSPGEAKACVKAGILAMTDYRAALRQDGYTEDAVLALELLLRTEIDERSDLEADRAAALADRAAEKAARARAAAERKVEIEADRALHRRGSLADLERAVVRGLVPMARYAEVLQPEYDGDTIEILVGLVEADRLAYVAQLDRAAEARKRAGVRNIDVGALEQATLTHVISPADFRQRLEQLGFPAGDADLLTATLNARMADTAAAVTKRAEAEAAAKRRSIDLGRYERLVVRGARSLPEYRALLASLGFDDGSQAGMVELLAGEIADAAAARKVRADAAAAALVKDVTLEQMRRAVILGTKTPAEYEQYLLTNKFTTDAQLVLMAELRADVADAADARQRRLDAEAESDRATLPLATVARAARLGLILPGVYQRRLEADHFSPEDVEIDMTLLTFEIAELVAARAKRDAPPPIPDPKGVSLGDLEHAVKLGLRSVDDYQARAFALGYSQEAVQTLVAVLRAEVQTLA